ncbi:hypothetical protein RYX36_000013 [Vicia faba]
MAYSNSVVFKFSIILIVIFAFKIRDIATFSINPRVTVTIKDVISGSIRLTVHCKSKDDDLGFHTLQSGQIYRFSFKPSAIITINTLFFCAFTWPGSPYRHYLDVYDQKRNTCTNCYWLISQQGGCLNGQCRVWQRIESIDAKNSTSKMVNLLGPMICITFTHKEHHRLNLLPRLNQSHNPRDV